MTAREVKELEARAEIPLLIPRLLSEVRRRCSTDVRIRMMHRIESAVSDNVNLKDIMWDNVEWELKEQWIVATR